ncbi:hypothetical protein HYS10_01455, partial [Candidatus Collierbacteria bacterium]|nr:hypothetical protein [Candidatus Collierbacteria bacterium]
IGVGYPADGDDLRLPAWGRKLAAQKVGCVFLHQDFRLEIKSRQKAQVFMGGAGVAVDAAMLAAPVRIDAGLEADVGTVVGSERLGKLILGFWGTLTFGLGLALNHKASWFYRLWFLGVIAYFVVFAGGNVTHDYYQAITIPFIAVLLAVGFNFLLKPSKEFSKAVSWPLAAVSFALMLFLSWYEIRGYYQINNWPIVEAGREADRLLPKDAKVIAQYNGDTAFLYQTGRSGWPAITTSLTKMVNEYGASYYVSVNYDDQTNKIMNHPGNEIIKKTKNYVIVQLIAKTQP